MQNPTTIKQALNPAFLKQPTSRAEIELFKEEFGKLLNNIKNTDEKESEEHYKIDVMNFLNAVYYKDKHYINTKGKTDLVIHNENNVASSVGVLIETKSPTNKTEMLRYDDFNVKSFQELVLYYLRERKTGKNFELRYLIITNVYEWFVFDAQDFEKLFYQNKTLLKRFEEFQEGKLAGTSTDFFYKEIASPEIARLTCHSDESQNLIKDKEIADQVRNDRQACNDKANQQCIPFVHFDIRDYEKILRNSEQEDERKLIALYKFLSPVHLLKLSFANDSNQLNKEFYAELLHVIGLEELTKDGRKLIERKKENERDSGSIIENTIEQIVSKNKLYDVKTQFIASQSQSQSQSTSQQQQFDVALDLAITWINRILFLKLLESQILKYHKGNRDYAFLSPEKLSGYKDVDTLFFSVLARKEDERTESIKRKFANVPYLNSSLFEMTDTENKTICIDSLQDNVEMELYEKSVLHGHDYGRGEKSFATTTTMRPLEYLLRFLDAYDFSNEGSEEIKEENKALISAAVLGLIFEKINGYKDGSFFTPSFITMYMCRETIGRAVIENFVKTLPATSHLLPATSPNIVQADNYLSLNDLHNLIPQIGIERANEIFNRIRICDPAVGSGHFLVSALNEMIYLKSQLGILTDKNGKSLWNYNVTVDNDELIVRDPNGDIFVYNPLNQESQRVQETLFHEKQKLIETCLFGVDINPNSVKICQLRLWIELLKHAYYINIVGRENFRTLQTLPNIDINIKCGNSLMSRFDLHDDFTKLTPTAMKNIKHLTQDYKQQVALYKVCTDKSAKPVIVNKINEIKSQFLHINNAKDSDYQNLEKAKNELELYRQSFNLFENENDDWNNKANELTEKLNKFERIYNDKIQGCFEWRFEFPEVLDDDGNFAGFDVVMGNPPYIQLQSMGSITESYKKLNYKVFERTGDIYCLFYERGYQLLKPQGRLCFITSNKWMRAGYGEKTRQFFAENTNPEQLIDFAGVKVFESATVDVNILLFAKDKNQQQTQACIVKKDGIKDLSVFIRQNSTTCSFSENESWVILSSIEQKIKQKIEAIGTPLKDWDIQINYGIKTGFNEAFIIDGQKRKELIEQDPKSAEIIRPLLRGRDIKRYGYEFADLYLLFIPWHFPLQNDTKIQGASEKAEHEFRQQYPAIYNHLLKYKKELSARNKAETGIRYEWYALQRWGANYWEDFYKQKIAWNRIANEKLFSFVDEGIFIQDSMHFFTGNHLKYLCAVLNSKLFTWFMYLIVGDAAGGNAGNADNVKNLTIPMFSSEQEVKVEKLLETHSYNAIDELIFKTYGLTNEEIAFITS